MNFQPLSGSGFKVNKPATTVERLRAEIARRFAETPDLSKVSVPAIVPADRGRNVANWQVADGAAVPLAAQPVIFAVMREFEVAE